MNNKVLMSFVNTCRQYPGNSNSLHKLGVNAKKLEEAASKQILSVLGLYDKQVVYTSGRCEANNLVIQGLMETHRKRRIISIGNDSLINDICYALDVEVVTFSSVSEEELKCAIDKNTLLITMSSIVSLNDLKMIVKVAKEYNVYTHLDLFDCNTVLVYCDVDLISVSFSDLLGIGALIKNKNILLEPIIHGGKSTTVYRSGTPALPFIVAFSKLVKLKYKK